MRAGEQLRRQRVEVADDEVGRGADRQREGAAAVGADHQFGAVGQGAVVRGGSGRIGFAVRPRPAAHPRAADRRVLPVEKDDREHADPTALPALRRAAPRPCS
jgi:hypothetical protein